MSSKPGNSSKTRHWTHARGALAAIRICDAGTGTSASRAGGGVVGAVARRAIERKTGARGLRSILESILLETMFDLPGLEGVEEVVISREVVEGTARPLYIYADRSDRANEAPASA